MVCTSTVKPSWDWDHLFYFQFCRLIWDLKPSLSWYGTWIYEQYGNPSLTMIQMYQKPWRNIIYHHIRSMKQIVNTKVDRKSYKGKAIFKLTVAWKWCNRNQVTSDHSKNILPISYHAILLVERKLQCSTGYYCEVNLLSVLVSMCEKWYHCTTMLKAFVKSGPETETTTQKSTVGWLLDALDFCLRPLDSSLSISVAMIKRP